MPVDTREPEYRLNHAGGPAPVWLFGYGSLICKLDFPYLERRVASVRRHLVDLIDHERSVEWRETSSGRSM